MANHDILTTRSGEVVDMESGSMDDETFRKMAEDLKRPRPMGVSLFRHPPHDAAAPPKPLVKIDLSTGGDKLEEQLRLSPINPDRVWESLGSVKLDADRLVGNGVFVNSVQSPASAAFDILRTRILQAMQERGWRRIAITSPTHGCGKSFVAANLALSLARRPSSRTVLIDMELRAPALAGLLRLKETPPLRDFLTGDQPLEGHFQKVGKTLALGLNGTGVTNASELLQEPATAEAIQGMMAQLDPQIAVFDAPPALGCDDMLALLPLVDAVLLVADGTQTTAADVRACERLLDGHAPLMGIVLNRAQDRDIGRYRYGRNK
jgi:Mrp family chromosome partitioning ATPase